MLILAAIIILPATASACAQRPERPEATARPSVAAAHAEAAAGAAGAADAGGYPDTVSFAEGSLPGMSLREFVLPPGVNVTDRTERLASYAQNSPAHWHPFIGLLDLRSGASRVVLRHGVNEALGYSPLGPRLSESWMAWEEVSPDEEAAPDKTQWFLYAAPLDLERLALGEPVLVDKGVTSYKLRPHYAVLGATVFWSANVRPGPAQESFPCSGEMQALDLSTGLHRTIGRTRTSYPTLCAADGAVSVTEVVAGTQNGVRAWLIDPQNGGVVRGLELGNTGRVAHFVRASRDWLGWAVEPIKGSEWPTLYVARNGSSSPAKGSTAARGEVLMAGINSIDPAFFGAFVAFESVDTIAAGSGSTSGLRQRARRIWVADLERRTRSLLLETRDDADRGWWQTCAGGLRTRTLLLWNDLGPWIDDQAQARTLVRLYTLTP